MLTVPKTIIVPNSDPTLLRLIEPYEFIYKHYRIPFYNNFEWDGASIPELATALPGIGSHYESKYLLASMVHDFLYSKAGAFYIKKRSECDKLFRELLVDQGVNKINAYRMYLAVRCFGWMSFRK